MGAGRNIEGKNKKIVFFLSTSELSGAPFEILKISSSQNS
jgi:hypothetical protein